MIDKQLYFEIAKRYGKVSSWAVWGKAGDKPKSNIGNMDVFDLAKNPSLLEILHTDVVMVALNFAREVEMNEPFLNFHDLNPHGQDYKIRFAFEGTDFYGAYMTDIIKEFPMLSSKDVLKYIKDKPNEVSKQINEFREELKFIGSYKPIILAFGRDAYNILNENMDKSEYAKLIPLIHYSHQISKENYRVDTHKRIGIVHS